MALDLSSLTNLGTIISDLLGKAKGEIPDITESVKELAEKGVNLFDKVKANIDSIVSGFGKMTPAQTEQAKADLLAALEAGSAQLRDDMDAMDAAPRVGQTTE